MTGTILVYTDDVNLLHDNLDVVKKSTETLIDGSECVCLEVNAEETTRVYFCLFIKTRDRTPA
jgi:nitrous oxide reductase